MTESVQITLKIKQNTKRASDMPDACFDKIALERPATAHIPSIYYLFLIHHARIVRSNTLSYYLLYVLLCRAFARALYIFLCVQWHAHCIRYSSKWVGIYYIYFFHLSIIMIIIGYYYFAQLLFMYGLRETESILFTFYVQGEHTLRTHTKMTNLYLFIILFSRLFICF